MPSNPSRRAAPAGKSAAPVTQLIAAGRPANAVASGWTARTVTPLPRQLADYAITEASIARDNFAALARCRTAPEFALLYGRLMIEFLQRATLRTLNLVDGAAG